MLHVVVHLAWRGLNTVLGWDCILEVLERMFRIAREAPSTVQLCVFDVERGQLEGHEHEKILFFYPFGTPLQAQVSSVGLSECLITFSSLFSPDAPCELIETERHSHFFYHCEPLIWMVLVLHKKGCALRADAARASLKGAYSLFTMFYGSLRSILDKYPTGNIARTCLHVILRHYLVEMLVGKEEFQLQSFANALSQPGMAKVLSFQQKIFLDAQSLVALLDCWFGCKIVHHCLIMYNDYLVSSTLPPGDRATLFLYAVLRLTPTAVSRAWTQLNSEKYYIASESRSHQNLPQTSGTLCNDEFFIQHSPEPLACWWQNSEGFLSLKGQIASALTIYLESSEKMELCVYQQKSLTVLMLSPARATVNSGSFKKTFVKKATQKLELLEEWLADGCLHCSVHIPGYRYLLSDQRNKLAKASPINKVVTLPKATLSALNQVRAELQLEKCRSNWDVHEEGLEVFIRMKNKSWVVVKHSRGDELYIVLERAHASLLATSDLVDKFIMRYCRNRFSRQQH